MPHLTFRKIAFRILLLLTVAYLFWRCGIPLFRHRQNFDLIALIADMAESCLTPLGILLAILLACPFRQSRVVKP